MGAAVPAHVLPSPPGMGRIAHVLCRLRTDSGCVSESPESWYETGTKVPQDAAGKSTSPCTKVGVCPGRCGVLPLLGPLTPHPQILKPHTPSPVFSWPCPKCFEAPASKHPDNPPHVCIRAAQGHHAQSLDPPEGARSLCRPVRQQPCMAHTHSCSPPCRGAACTSCVSTTSGAALHSWPCRPPSTAGPTLYEDSPTSTVTSASG